MKFMELKEKFKNITQLYSNQGDEPRQQLWIEALGAFLFCFGLFMLISLMGYDAQDIQRLAQNQGDLKNWGGPMGANLSHFLTMLFGQVDFLWPLAFMAWGPLVSLGRVTHPPKKQFIAAVLLTLTLASLVEVFFPNTSHPFGNGGLVGRFFGSNLSQIVGTAGAIIFLGFAAIASLIFTRNISLSKSTPLGENSGLEPQKATKNSSKKSSDNEKLSTTPAMDSEESKDQKKTKGKKNKSDDEKTIQEPPKPSLLDLGPAKGAPPKMDSKIFKNKPLVISKSQDESETMSLISSKLTEFGVKGEVVGVTQGPVVKTYEFEPAAGTKVSKIESLQNDLARLLKTESLRVVPVKGQSTVGFEIPNDQRKVIPLGNLVGHSQFKSKDKALPIAMGVDTFGKPVIEDLAEMPHLLVAGSTGSGKSVYINTLIVSLLARHSAKDLRLVLIDPKMVELGAFNDCAHMAGPVVTDVAKDGLPILQSLVDEMENRYEALKAVGAKNLTSFNTIIKTKKKSAFKNYKGLWQPLPYVVVVVDEFADLMMSVGKEVEQLIARLAQKARAAGIHLVIATQRPSVKVVTGLIKANFPTRIGFRVTSGVDSRTILDQGGAETLLGKGDMLYMSSSGLVRLHSGFLDEAEIHKAVRQCKGKHQRKAA